MISPSQPPVRLQGVSHRFGRGPVVLQDVDLTMTAGEVLVVRGANGSGKSTMLKIAAGVLHARSGRVARHAPVAYLPQTGPEPPPGMSAAQWWRFVCDAGEPPRRLLEALGGPPPASPLRELSGGSLAKVLLAAALSRSPGLIVLDEPFSALDAASRMAAIGLIEQAAGQGSAVLLSDHFADGAGPAGRLAALAAGRLTIEDGPVTAGRWRLVTRAAAGPDGPAAPQVVLVSGAERDRLLLDVLAAGGQVLGVEELR